MSLPLRCNHGYPFKDFILSSLCPQRGAWNYNLWDQELHTPPAQPARHPVHHYPLSINPSIFFSDPFMHFWISVHGKFEYLPQQRLICVIRGSLHNSKRSTISLEQCKGQFTEKEIQKINVNVQPHKKSGLYKWKSQWDPPLHAHQFGKK